MPHLVTNRIRSGQRSVRGGGTATEFALIGGGRWRAALMIPTATLRPFAHPRGLVLRAARRWHSRAGPTRNLGPPAPHSHTGVSSASPLIRPDYRSIEALAPIRVRCWNCLQ